MAHGAHQKLPIDPVEETFDVEVKHPVPLPTSLPSHGYRVVGRFPWPISIGVLVELRLQYRFQILLDYRLGDSIGHRRNSERTRLSGITLRNVNPAHGRRKVGSGTHPIPDSIEIVTQVSLEILDGLPVNSCRPSVRLHLLIRFPHLAFRNTERLGFIHAGPPPAGCPPD